jgi:hypothetical protein
MYSDIFCMKRVNSESLRDSYVKDELVSKGYVWIRRHDPQGFHNIVRFPTTGCFLEAFKLYHVGCVKMDSAEGKKLIGKYCYF